MIASGDQLPDDDHVSRWCRRRDVDPESGRPKVSAFYPRQSEDYLSFNWIEYHAVNHETAIDGIRDSIPLTKHEDDKFVVLNVAEVMESILAGGGQSPSVRFCPKCNNPSHVATDWEELHKYHQLVAAELQTLVNNSENVYLGTKRN